MILQFVLYDRRTQQLQFSLPGVVDLIEPIITLSDVRLRVGDLRDKLAHLFIVQHAVSDQECTEAEARCSLEESISRLQLPATRCVEAFVQSFLYDRVSALRKHNEAVSDFDDGRHPLALRGELDLANQLERVLSAPNADLDRLVSAGEEFKFMLLSELEQGDLIGRAALVADRLLDLRGDAIVVDS